MRITVRPDPDYIAMDMMADTYTFRFYLGDANSSVFFSSAISRPRGRGWKTGVERWAREVKKELFREWGGHGH